MAFTSRHFRRVALACALFLASFVTFLASPAFAHDTLKRSSPAKNAQVSSVEEIELEYTASVKFPFVALHDAAGKEVALGKPRLDGPRVLADLPQPLAPGSYVLAWRVVSSDGHPIEGEIPFSVKGSPSSSASPSATDEGSAAGAPSAAASPATGPATDPAAGPAAAAGPSEAAGEGPAASGGVPGWIWGGLAVLVVLGAFVLFRTSRRGPDREEVDAG